MLSGLSFTVWGLGFRVWGLGFRVYGLGQQKASQDASSVRVHTVDGQNPCITHYKEYTIIPIV